MSVPVEYVERLRRAEARRGARCAKCGVHQRKAKLVATEAGWHCRPHAQQLSPYIARHDEDQGHEDEDMLHDIHEAERKVELARARLRATRRGATLSDGAAIHEAERQLTIAFNQLAAAWTARLIRDDSAA